MEEIPSQDKYDVLRRDTVEIGKKIQEHKSGEKIDPDQLAAKIYIYLNQLLTVYSKSISSEEKAKMPKDWEGKLKEYEDYLETNMNDAYKFHTLKELRVNSNSFLVQRTSFADLEDFSRQKNNLMIRMSKGEKIDPDEISKLRENFDTGYQSRV